jgi:DNA mismatch endonuclease (patch repair protein)
LDALGIKYEKQVLICDKFVVDTFIPSRKLVIQWDGDYWHGFGGATDKRQERRMALDKSQDKYMRKAGYGILRFWEHEVHQLKEKVRENIRRAIQ